MKSLYTPARLDSTLGAEWKCKIINILAARGEHDGRVWSQEQSRVKTNNDLKPFCRIQRMMVIVVVPGSINEFPAATDVLIEEDHNDRTVATVETSVSGVFSKGTICRSLTSLSTKIREARSKSHQRSVHNILFLHPSPCRCCSAHEHRLTPDGDMCIWSIREQLRFCTITRKQYIENG